MKRNLSKAPVVRGELVAFQSIIDSIILCFYDLLNLIFFFSVFLFLYCVIFYCKLQNSKSSPLIIDGKLTVKPAKDKIHLYICNFFLPIIWWIIKDNCFCGISQKLWQMQTTQIYTVLLSNTPAQAESLLPNLKQVARGFGLYANSDKTEFLCFNQDGAISSLNDKPPKLATSFYISSTESDINIYISKAWTAIVWLLVIWKSDLSNKRKWNFFTL